MDGIDNYQHNPSQSSRQLRCLKSKGEQRRRSFCGFGILLVHNNYAEKNYRETESKTLTVRIVKIAVFSWNPKWRFFCKNFVKCIESFLLQNFRESISTDIIIVEISKFLSQWFWTKIPSNQLSYLVH